MTTARVTSGSTARPDRRATVGGQVRAALLVTALLGLVGTGLGALLGGSPAALGAAVGFAMVLVFFGTGAVVVNAVASVSPSASMLVALLTYTLQVVLVGVVFAALDRSGALDGTVDRTWAGGGRRGRDAGLVGVSHHLRDPVPAAPVRPPRTARRTARRRSAR